MTAPTCGSGSFRTPLPWQCSVPVGLRTSRAQHSWEQSGAGLLPRPSRRSGVHGARTARVVAQPSALQQRPIAISRRLAARHSHVQATQETVTLVVVGFPDRRRVVLLALPSPALAFFCPRGAEWFWYMARGRSDRTAARVATTSGVVAAAASSWLHCRGQ